MRKTIAKTGQAKYRLFKGQLSSLVLHGQITTTLSRAKYLKSKAEKFVADIKKYEKSFTLKRFLAIQLYGGSVDKAFDLKDEFKSVSVYKLDKRFGDGAQKAIVVLNKYDLKKPVKSSAKPVKSEKAENEGA